MHIKFPSIEAFHNVRKELHRIGMNHVKIPYGGKVKLHGTNAGIQIKEKM